MNDKKIKKYMHDLSDTDLGLGISTLLTKILNKLPLQIKVTILKDEVEMAEISLEELHRRLKRGKRK